MNNLIISLLFGGAVLSSEFTSSCYAEINKQYYQGEYSLDHWAQKPFYLSDTGVVALGYYKDSEYAVFMNPTDKRGYRCIVRLIKNGDMQSTFNRDYTTQEKIGFGLTVQLIADVYAKILPISQVAIAGNISQKLDNETGITLIGVPGEPSLLHGHIFGRGNPESRYIGNIKLDGPVPGLNFDMMGKTVNEPGNNAKVKWADGEMKEVAERLKVEIESSKREYEQLGLQIITE